MKKQTGMHRLIGSKALLAGAILLVVIGQPLELRGQVAGPQAEASGLDKPVRVIQGRYSSDVRLTSNVVWVLRGAVSIAAPARILIDPDTRVIAEAATAGTFMIERGAEIVTNGTIEAPIVFTNGQPQGWVGLMAGTPASQAGTDSHAQPGGGGMSFGLGSTAAGSAESGGSGPTTPTVGQTVQRVEASPLASQTVGPPVNVPGIDKPVRIIYGRFTNNLVLTSDAHWVLRGAVFIDEPGTITIQPGTRVVGETATAGTLIVERGAKIFADGTADAPIVFTSDQPIGQRGRGDWGGLIINGRAPVNLPGGVGIGEGDTGVYGGNDPDDNSGILRYVRVEFAGIEFSPDNELNGIAFQGVGRGTIVDHIQVSFNKDDGIEMFGGTVDIKRVVLTGIADDSIDWTFGWRGRLQFAVVQQRGDDADRGIEADNNANNNDLLPRSKPTLYNITLIGDPDFNEGPESTQGMILREGTAGIIRNFIVMGFKSDGIRVANTSTLAQVANGELSVRHGIVFQNGTNLPGNAATLVAAAGGTIDVVDPQLIRPYDLINPGFRPAPGSPPMLMSFEPPPNDGFFEPAPFRGALSSDPAQDWTLGWTNYDQR